MLEKAKRKREGREKNGAEQTRHSADHTHSDVEGDAYMAPVQGTTAALCADFGLVAPFQCLMSANKRRGKSSIPLRQGYTERRECCSVKLQRFLGEEMSILKAFESNSFFYKARNYIHNQKSTTTEFSQNLSV